MIKFWNWIKRTFRKKPSYLKQYEIEGIEKLAEHYFEEREYQEANKKIKK